MEKRFDLVNTVILLRLCRWGLYDNLRLRGRNLLEVTHPLLGAHGERVEHELETFVLLLRFIQGSLELSALEVLLIAEHHVNDAPYFLVVTVSSQQRTNERGSLTFLSERADHVVVDVLREALDDQSVLLIR